MSIIFAFNFAPKIAQYALTYLRMAQLTLKCSRRRRSILWFEAQHDLRLIKEDEILEGHEMFGDLLESISSRSQWHRRYSKANSLCHHPQTLPLKCTARLLAVASTANLVELLHDQISRLWCCICCVLQRKRTVKYDLSQTRKTCRFEALNTTASAIHLLIAIQWTLSEGPFCGKSLKKVIICNLQHSPENHNPGQQHKR